MSQIIRGHKLCKKADYNILPRAILTQQAANEKFCQAKINLISVQKLRVLHEAFLCVKNETE